MLQKTLQHTLAPYQSANRWWLAFSGGSDSTALLHAVASIPASSRPAITAVHIHHGLSPNANYWAAHCAQVCQKLGVSFVCARVQLPVNSNIEDTARTARYALFDQLIGTNELLLMAHHQQDQAETLLYRLMRGSGIKGLSGMPATRAIGKGRLLRPLLGQSKSSILDYLERHALAIIDDESNQDERFDRNYLRATVLPALSRRWPKAERQLLKAQRHLLEASELLNDLAAQDIAKAKGVLANRHYQWCLPHQPLRIESLAEFSRARLNNALHHYFSQQGLVLSEQQLAQLVSQCVLDQKQGQKPLIKLPPWQIRVAADCLLLEPYHAVEPSADLAQPLKVGGFELGSHASLEVSLATGEGLRQSAEYAVKPVPQSTRFKPHWRGHSTTLKKLMQELKLPYWHRPYLFGVWQGEQLVAVQGVGCKREFLAESGQLGFMLKLRVGGFVYLCP